MSIRAIYSPHGGAIKFLLLLFPSNRFLATFPLNFLKGGYMEAIVLIGIYFVPTIIAAIRQHHNGIPIFLVNILLGWTFIGWVVALIWSCTAVQPQLQKPTQAATAPPPSSSSQKASGSDSSSSCPYCFGQVDPRAQKCPHCAEWITGNTGKPIT